MVWLGKDELNPQFGRVDRRHNRAPSQPSWQLALEKARPHVDEHGMKQWHGERQRCDWVKLPQGCDPSSGGLSVVRAWRKRRQIENLMGPVEWLASMRSPNAVSHLGTERSKGALKIVEFCAGSGHVGLAAAAILSKSPRLAGMELRVDINEVNKHKIATIQERLLAAGGDVRALCEFYTQPLETYPGKFDVGIALHGCGAATDAVLDRCLLARAAFVLVPCCVGRLAQPQFFPSRPRSQKFGAVLSSAEMRSLSRSGDCTVRCRTKLSPDDHLRRDCKKVVDADRLALAQEAGYLTSRFTMSPFGCTPKNDVLLGWPKEWEDQRTA